MSFNAEVEISKLWKSLHLSQDEIGKNFFRCRQIFLEISEDNNLDFLSIILKVAKFSGEDEAKKLFSKLNWLKGEKKFIFSFGKILSKLWVIEGGLASVDNIENSNEVFINCFRDPWPTWGKEYGVTMEELILYREVFLKSIVKEVSLFFNISLKIKIIKAIPRGDGVWKIRLYKNNK